MRPPHPVSFDPSFPHSYRCESRSELSVSLPQWNFGVRDGVIVEVEPQQGSAWQGIFGFGDARDGGVTALTSTPDPRVLCVVARGAGVFVDCEHPADCKAVECCWTVLGLHAIKDEGVLLFHDNLRFAAYDERGLAWNSSRVALDGIRDVRVDGRRIRAQVWRGEDWIETELELFS